MRVLFLPRLVSCGGVRNLLGASLEDLHVKCHCPWLSWYFWFSALQPVQDCMTWDNSEMQDDLYLQGKHMQMLERLASDQTPRNEMLRDNTQTGTTPTRTCIRLPV